MVCGTRTVPLSHVAAFSQSYSVARNPTSAKVSLISVKQGKYFISLRYMHQARKGNDPSAHMRNVTTSDCSNLVYDDSNQTKRRAVHAPTKKVSEYVHDVGNSRLVRTQNKY